MIGRLILNFPGGNSLDQYASSNLEVLIPFIDSDKIGPKMALAVGISSSVNIQESNQS